MKTDIAKLFRETRKAYGKTQNDFSKLVGCSRVILSLYETGKIIPGADKYDALLSLRDNLSQSLPQGDEKA